MCLRMDEKWYLRQQALTMAGKPRRLISLIAEGVGQQTGQGQHPGLVESSRSEQVRREDQPEVGGDDEWELCWSGKRRHERRPRRCCMVCGQVLSRLLSEKFAVQILLIGLGGLDFEWESGHLYRALIAVGHFRTVAKAVGRENSLLYPMRAFPSFEFLLALSSAVIMPDGQSFLQFDHAIGKSSQTLM
jgi:hypothetical protein